MIRKYDNRKLNEKLTVDDLDYYERAINNHFDEQIAYIKKYTKQLENLKNEIYDMIDYLKSGEYANTYVKTKISQLDGIVSNLRECRSKMDAAELSAEQFIDTEDTM